MYIAVLVITAVCGVYSLAGNPLFTTICMIIIGILIILIIPTSGTYVRNGGAEPHERIGPQGILIFIFLGYVCLFICIVLVAAVGYERERDVTVYPTV